MKHRTTPAMLAVVALLLALNLAAQLPWPTAQAQLQPEIAMQPPPRLVGIATVGTSSDRVLRLWSDGVVEWRRLNYTFVEWSGVEWQVVEQQ